MRVALNGLFLDAPATGTGQYLRELVSAMREQAPDDEIRLIAPHADVTAPAPVQVHRTRLRQENAAKVEFEQFTFPRVSRAFDIAHVPHFGSPLFPTRPTVVTIHDLIPLVLPAYASSFTVRLYNRLVSRAARRATSIVADSHASASDIESHLHIARAKIHVVHLAAHSRFQPPSEPEIERVREKYHLPEKFVLYLGGFDVRKNVERVVETFASWKGADATRESGAGPKSGWQLVIAGKLPERTSAFFPDPREMAEKFGVAERVCFGGFVAEEDKPGLYAAARVFLFPSRYEGFGLPPLEAMACGTPVIAANISSLPEVVGEGGILLAPDDASAWNRALRELLTDEARWNEMRAQGLIQARRFSWANTARATLDVYRAVA